MPPKENIGERVTQSQQCRILLSTSLVAFTVLGFVQSFGVFQAHYGRIEAVRDGVLQQDEMTRRALISSIGSLGNGGLVAVFGVFYYPHLPRIGRHIRTFCFVGTTFITFGLAMAAASHSIWVLFGCQGILVGLGSGVLNYILSPILPEYFPRRSGLAQGTMYAAAALGGTTFSFAITGLLEKVGTRSTLGILAVCSSVLLSVASALALPPRKFEKRSTEMVGWRAFKDPLFTSLALVNLIHPLTLAIPMTFGPAFSQALGTSVKQASYLLALNSGIGIPSRLGAGALADKIGHQNTLMIATAVYALATWALWLPSALTGKLGLYIGMSVCHGLINGVFNTVMNSAQKEMFGDEMYYPKNGAMTSIRGVGYVVGVPIAGALVSKVADKHLSGRDFTKPIVYTAALLTISFICLLNVRRIDAKNVGWKRAR
ncbi:MFS general substrate transporter [Cucurbitaria berberidis CBS 394.84]|uniref:MFS general substrate transporter n=1 Tax=Cucurbitaria berberidis CBS 394.84 TaxID=1168544 RepID=A0A9P4LFD5_9PLEO|nr:MFS general substrate transporter [Cucurbitaria berberidis CBS 394.84]KAF1851959.1 MFS general substrate transporter [Cucurbitaria berberidis CBS 394.84]